MTRRMGVGFIARNDGGVVVAAMCASRPYITDPDTAEAVVAWMLAWFHSDHSGRGLVGDSSCSSTAG
jgi:hypothetical protein